MSDWREYRSSEACTEWVTAKQLHTPRVLIRGRLEVFRMKNEGEYAVHVKPASVTAEERKRIKKRVLPLLHKSPDGWEMEYAARTNRHVHVFGFHGGLAFADSGNRGFRRPELFFVLDGTDMGYKAAYEDMNTGEVRTVKDAWRSIQIAELTDSSFSTLGELYDYLCR